MMPGVLARGTARSIAAFSPYVAGEAGTSDDEDDAWFLGFTNDVTGAVWLGYDIGRKTPHFGRRLDGRGVAVPIFEPVIQAVWAHVAPKARLAPPSPDAKRQLACKSTDLESGEPHGRGKNATTECFRLSERRNS
jgi:penicillin-binding protein 1A